MPFSVSSRATVAFVTLVVVIGGAVFATELIYFVSYTLGSPFDYRLHQPYFWEGLWYTTILVLRGTVLVSEIVLIIIGMVLGFAFLFVAKHLGVFSPETAQTTELLLDNGIERLTEIGDVKL